MFLDHIEDYAGIDGPASRSHHEAVDGSESHRVRNAAAVPHCAQAGAVAEMREDDSSACEVGRQFAQPRHKKLVGKAMKPVAPNARVRKPPRQSKCLGQIRLTAMKSRVETRDLRYLRRSIQDCANGSEIVRLVKRRQRRELHEVVEHIRRYPRGTIVVEAAMDYAVTETDLLSLPATACSPSRGCHVWRRRGRTPRLGTCDLRRPCLRRP